MKNYLSVLVSLFIICLTSSQPYTSGPIVGIITIPSEVDDYPPDKWSYFPSSYVKFVESGGAQVVPIQYDMPQESLVYVLERLNGVLLTGGDSVFVDNQGQLTPIAKTISFVVEYILEQNMIGNYYPLWGTCQGFEVIAMILGKNFSILSNCNGCTGVNKNDFLEPAYQSKLFAGLPDDLKEKMTFANLSHFFESYKLDINAFQENILLSNIVTPVSYTYDEAGVKYVSSYESPFYPIYATQFHPETATFEWVSLTPANHNYDAVSLQLYLADFLVNEARKNLNIFPNHQQYLIDNYNVTIRPIEFSSVYLFPSLSSRFKVNQEQYL